MSKSAVIALGAAAIIAVVLLFAGMVEWAEMGSEQPGQQAGNAELKPPQPSPQ